MHHAWPPKTLQYILFFQRVLLATVIGTCKTAEKFFDLAGRIAAITLRWGLSFCIFFREKTAGVPRVFALRNLKVETQTDKKKRTGRRNRD